MKEVARDDRGPGRASPRRHGACDPRTGLGRRHRALDAPALVPDRTRPPTRSTNSRTRATPPVRRLSSRSSARTSSRDQEPRESPGRPRRLRVRCSRGRTTPVDRSRAGGRRATHGHAARGADRGVPAGRRQTPGGARDGRARRRATIRPRSSRRAPAGPFSEAEAWMRAIGASWSLRLDALKSLVEGPDLHVVRRS
jgi:hypothetical protein